MEYGATALNWFLYGLPEYIDWEKKAAADRQLVERLCAENEERARSRVVVGEDWQWREIKIDTKPKG